MSQDSKKEKIRVWQPPEVDGLELRQGIGVSAPYPRHWHEEYQLCLVQSGGGELHYRGARHNTPATSLFIVHPGEVHSNQTDHRFGCSFRSIYVTPALLRRAAADVQSQSGSRHTPNPFFPAPIILDREISTLYHNLHKLMEIRQSGLEQESLFLELIAELVQRYAQHRTASPALPGHLPAVRRAREYISQHYSRNISLDELSNVADLSPWHLTRIFCKEVGMPPHAYQIQLRIAHARKLLREGWSVSDVSAQTGFADQSHFTRHFKRLMLITPGRYINNSKNVQDAS